MKDESEAMMEQEDNTGAMEQESMDQEGAGAMSQEDESKKESENKSPLEMIKDTITGLFQGGKEDSSSKRE